MYRMGSEEVHALDGLDFRIHRGEYWSVMGPSGSGKSTLLNVMGCLDRPTAGTYRLAGYDVSELDDDELSELRSIKLGFIFQSYNLIPQLDVLENIMVPLFYQGVDDFTEQVLIGMTNEVQAVCRKMETLVHTPIMHFCFTIFLPA